MTVNPQFGGESLILHRTSILHKNNILKKQKSVYCWTVFIFYLTQGQFKNKITELEQKMNVELSEIASANLNSTFNGLGETEELNYAVSNYFQC